MHIRPVMPPLPNASRNKPIQTFNVMPMQYAHTSVQFSLIRKDRLPSRPLYVWTNSPQLKFHPSVKLARFWIPPTTAVDHDRRLLGAKLNKTSDVNRPLRWVTIWTFPLLCQFRFEVIPWPTHMYSHGVYQVQILIPRYTLILVVYTGSRGQSFRCRRRPGRSLAQGRQGASIWCTACAVLDRQR